jgi:hypothetical protein
MKRYSIPLIITALLIPSLILFVDGSAAQITETAISSQQRTEIVQAYKSLARGIPGRREGGGTR